MAAVEVAKTDSATTALATQGAGPVTPAMQFTGTAATISAPGDAFRIADDLDVRVLLAMDDWTPTPGPGTTMTLVSRGKDTGGPQFKFELNNLGGLIFRWSLTGSSAFTAESSLVLLAKVPNGSPLWVRVAFDSDNGNSGSELYFYTSSDGRT
ncbi:hypothetical protein [Citricoccus sp. K5]|uniref:hypothetical protein n=1 Tax=Citricoccus sp. K5 TaxID=2653135 RepID=UPI001356FD70|nr:hypothetical protein [Citricoccus sp. K5]